ncbi:hypothetical protein B7463_g6872, partial [Scytalidium lignicola]
MQRYGCIRKGLSQSYVTFSKDRVKVLFRHDSSSSRKYNIGKPYEATVNIEDITHPFFNYTSGRCLYNEHLRLSERRLVFNVNELCRLIAKSAGQLATNIILFTKFAEGGSYRILEATFRDGLKVTARLPYPSTIPRRYGIASEVATMEFLRLNGVPVPKVFDWNSSSSNEVGSEYIIMERVQGRELEEMWLRENGYY